MDAHKKDNFQRILFGDRTDETTELFPHLRCSQQLSFPVGESFFDSTFAPLTNLDAPFVLAQITKAVETILALSLEKKYF